MIVVSADCLFVRIVVGWVVVGSLGWWGHWGGYETYFWFIVYSYVYPTYEGTKIGENVVSCMM